MAKPRITLTTPYDRQGTLVFWCQKSPWNSNEINETNRPWKGRGQGHVTNFRASCFTCNHGITNIDDFLQIGHGGRQQNNVASVGDTANVDISSTTTRIRRSNMRTNSGVYYRYLTTVATGSHLVEVHYEQTQTDNRGLIYKPLYRRKRFAYQCSRTN